MASLPQTLPEVVENIGFGWAQLKVALFGGGVWLADGAELLLISAVTRSVAIEWNLTALEKGAVVSIVFWGTLAGNIMSGPVGDFLGRRFPILASFLGILVFSLASASAQSFQVLCFARFFVGLAFGFGQPCFQAMAVEVTPCHWRAFVAATANCFSVVGQTYSVGLILYDDPAMKNLNWRWLLRMGAIPAGILLVLNMVWLRQSPFFLSAAGRHREAKEVLRGMAVDNGVADIISVEYTAPEPVHGSEAFLDSIARHFAIIFSRELWLSSLIVIYSCFVLNFSYYGSLYAFPQIIGDVDLPGAPGVELLAGAALEIPGYLLANLLCVLLPRKSVIKVYLAGMTIFLVTFSYFARAGKNAITAFFVSVGYYGVKFCPAIGIVTLYQYCAELYPTESRATGSALSLAGGRLAGILSPLVYESLTVVVEFRAFFLLMACMCVLNMIMMGFLPYETADKQLDDVMLKPPDLDSRTYGAA